MKDYSAFMEIGRIVMDYDRSFKSYIKEQLTEYNLSVAEVLVLLALFENDGQRADQLLEQIAYDKSVMTRTLQSLEKNAYVKREQNLHDRRSWLFYMTDKAQTVREPITSALRDWCSQAFTGLSPADLGSLLNLMRNIQSNLTSHS